MIDEKKRNNEIDNIFKILRNLFDQEIIAKEHSNYYNSLKSKEDKFNYILHIMLNVGLYFNKYIINLMCDYAFKTSKKGKEIHFIEGIESLLITYNAEAKKECPHGK